MDERDPRWAPDHERGTAKGHRDSELRGALAKKSARRNLLPEVSENNFIDVSLLATPRLRRMAEIMSHLPEGERRELADLIFAQVNENVQTILQLRRKPNDRRSG